MKKQGSKENRTDIRVYFNKEQTLGGTLLHKESPEPIDCAIWGISMGGVRLSVERDLCFDKGEKMVLASVSDRVRTVSSSPIEIEVVWSMHQPESTLLFAGCRFTNIGDDSKAAFARIIRQELDRRNRG